MKLLETTHQRHGESSSRKLIQLIILSHSLGYTGLFPPVAFYESDHPGQEGQIG